MNSLNRIVEIFKKNNTKFRSKKIGLFGIGPITSAIINECNHFNFVAVIDSSGLRGQFYGVPQIRIEDISHSDIDVVIIIAKPNSVKVIYNMIHECCYRNQIGLYGINGSNLYDYYGHPMISQKTQNHLKLDFESVRLLIDSHEVISFDIFDTLIMRKVLRPTDIFELMSFELVRRGIEVQTFVEKRIISERKSTTHCTIDDIYETFVDLYDIDSSTAEIIKKMEIELEGKMLITRNNVLQLLNYALSTGKKVALISDMYMPEHIIRGYLNTLNIPKGIPVLVSCDYGTNKSEGLFDVFKKQVRGGSYIHIGDNKVADGNCENFGISSVIIKSALELCNMSSLAMVYDSSSTLNEKCLLGMVISRAFNDPFVLSRTDGRVGVYNNSDYIDLVWGPFLVGMINWICRAVDEYDGSEVIFRREDKLAQDLYDKIGSINFGRKLPISRNSEKEVFTLEKAKPIAFHALVNTSEEYVFNGKDLIFLLNDSKECLEIKERKSVLFYNYSEYVSQSYLYEHFGCKLDEVFSILGDEKVIQFAQEYYEEVHTSNIELSSSLSDLYMRLLGNGYTFMKGNGYE